MKRTNNGVQLQINGQPLAEFVEKRPPAKGNSDQTTVTSTQRLESTSSGLGRVREAAKRDKNLRFTNLLHHIDTDLLHTAYMSLNKKAATGLDGVTWQEYGKEIKTNFTKLHDQIYSGSYRATVSKRIWIAKSDGQQHPIGITALEDKIVQQALVEILASRGLRRRKVVQDRGGDTTRCRNIAITGERLSALRLRPLGEQVAQPPCTGRSLYHTLRR